MNTTVTRSINKTPYEIVFGQRANTFHNVSMEVPSVNLSGLEDIVESQLEEEQVEGERNVEFSVSQRKGTQQSESSSAEIDRKRRKLLNFSIHDPINIVEKEAFEVTCPVREEIKETVKKTQKKAEKKWKKDTTVRKKSKQVNIMSETMSPYTYPKKTGIQQMPKDCHVLLPTKAVENNLLIGLQRVADLYFSCLLSLFSPFFHFRERKNED